MRIFLERVCAQNQKLPFPLFTRMPRRGLLGNSGFFVKVVGFIAIP